MAKRSPIVHIEWRSRDAARLREFYRNVFRWKFDESMPGYAMAETGSKNLGVGLMQIESGSPIQQGVVSFVEAQDLSGTESAIREAGGQVIASSQPVPGLGRFSLFTDPDGNPLGLWQSETSAKAETKRAKKAETKRAKASAKANSPSDEERAAKKAAKKAAKAEQKSAKAAKQAAKDAKKAAKKAEEKLAKEQKRAAARDSAERADKKADKKAAKVAKKKKDDGLAEAAR